MHDIEQDRQTTAPAAIVTGGSGGIGQAICAMLLARSLRVVNLDKTPSHVKSKNLINIEVDLSDVAATAGAAQQAARSQAISTVVHNVGVIRPASVDTVKAADFEYLFALHLQAALSVVQACLPSLRNAEHARIVVISSRAALGLPTRTAYSATKAGLIGLTRTWALELAAQNITVNAIAPGPIAGTGMFHELIPAGSEKMAELANAIPLKRLGTPADVAHAVDFFVAPQSGFITGQVLYVCGGSSVGSLSL